MKMLRNDKGIALITVYIILAALITLGGMYASRSMSEFRFSQRQKDEVRAYYAAEAGINLVAIDIYNRFKNSAEWQNTRSLLAIYTWFGYPDSEPGWNATRRRNALIAHYGNFPITGAIDGCQYSVMLPSAAADPVSTNDGGVYITIVATGTVAHYGGTVRKVVEATVSYPFGPSMVFDYAYFVNNFGWLYGGGINVNGNVRSNGNFAFQGNPMINGDIFAAVNPALGAAGTIAGNSRNWTTDEYINHESIRARPTDPTDPSDPMNTVYPAGYDGISTRYQHEDMIDMPYLGDLSTYKDLARTKNGTISQGGATVVNNVYEGNGPDGAAGTADDGSIVLIGTEANPIEISGPVVVQNDVVIKGIIKGRGTIYSGRNMHIIGDIKYSDPPSWPKPDTDPSATDQSNKTKDFVGFASKGNVIIGDYTRNDWLTVTEDYLKPPFTQAYETDPTDASIGYDSDNDPSNGYWFNGDYTASDGGVKDDGKGGTAQRKYYESSLSDDYIHSIADSSSSIRNVDGVIYNNHAYAGKAGRFNINGSMISRDEAIIYSGSITMNYDARAYGSGLSAIDIYLPRDLRLPQTKVTKGE